jgi:CheY-like chemotaxis protein
MAKIILIIDDVPEEALPLVHYLNGKGYDVRFEKSGEEALRFLSIQQPDVIICDLEMSGMGGYDWVLSIEQDDCSQMYQ